MFLNRTVGVGSLAVVSLALLLLPARSASAQRGADAAASRPNAVVDVLPRRASPKTPTAELTIPAEATGEIIVKFNDTVRARVQAGVLNAQGAINVAPARAIMNQFQLTAEPLFNWTNDRLGRLEAKATAVSGKAQPDLAGMIKFKAPWANLQAAARALNDLDSVEWVSFRKDLRPLAGVLRRCCFPEDGHCELFTLADCIALQGSPGGVGSDCTFECGPGACCVLGDCEVTFDEEDCIVLGGIYQGWDPGVDCADIDCAAVQCGSVPEPCFESHLSPACNDEDCCELVCGFLPTCCELFWDLQCTSLANLHCTTPGPPTDPDLWPDRCASPDNGDCFEVHFTSGCVDSACCNLVCTAEPLCCAVFGFWDGLCVSQAQSLCGEPPATGTTPLKTSAQGYLRENSYLQQAGGPPAAISFPFNTMGGGWNMRGDNYALWVINEINIDVSAGSGDANGDGSVNAGDQFVEIVNNFDIDLLLDGWEIRTFDDFATTPVTRHVFPVGTVVDDNEAIVVFAVAPADPDDPVYGGSVVQGASSGSLGFFAPPTPGQTGTVQLFDANGTIMSSYTWSAEASQNASIRRFPDVIGSDASLFASANEFTPGTQENGDVFTTNFEGLYGLSRELIEVFGIGETIPPGTNNFDDLRYNARGKGINVAVIEWSFWQDHEDLDVITEPGQTLLPIIENVPDHATACLGIINGQENSFGVTGVAPDSQAYFFPLISVEEGDRDAAAFLSAYETLNAGDIVSCSFGPNGNINNELPFWTLMRLGSDLGITTCLAAANSCIDLSQLNDLGDSGAVVVGAGDPGFPWCRRSFSNYFQGGDFNDSNVVHCQAWGVAVQTTGYGTDPTRSYTSSFSGTSAAAPQIAGLAACLQGLAKQFYGIPLGPLNIRAALATGFLQCGFADPDELPGFPVLPGEGCLPDIDPDAGPNKIGIYPRPARGQITSGNSVLNNSGFNGSPLIDDLVIITGELIHGNVFSIKGADDNYLVIESRAANANGVGTPGHNGGIVTGQTTMFQVGAHMQNPNIESIEVDIEAFVDNGTGIQLLYMFDWQLNRWLAIAVQFLGVGDNDTATVFPVENASRFIRSSDNRLMLRVQTVALGVGGLHRSFTDWVNISRGLGDAFISSDP